MNIAPHMMEKMTRALKEGCALFNLDDIQMGLRNGSMQGHVEGNTWAITQIHDWPHRRSVNVLYVIGDLEEAIKMEPKLESWAVSVGADLITATGRDGWWEHKIPGWRKVGTLYAKDIDHGRS